MLTLKKILKQPDARSTFDKLVEDKLDERLLEYWLRYIAGSSDTTKARRFERRKVSSLVKKVRKLATEIEQESQTPAIPFIGRGPDIERIVALPKRLRTYADSLETSLSIRVSGNVSSRSEGIAALLEIVKEVTGRYHYEEVAVLLNAVDIASGRGEDGPLWDVTNLKQRQYLARKRLSKGY